MQRFKSQGQAQKFVATHSAIYNIFNIQRHLISRKTMRHFRSAAFGMECCVRRREVKFRIGALARAPSVNLTKPPALYLAVAPKAPT